MFFQFQISFFFNLICIYFKHYYIHLSFIDLKKEFLNYIVLGFINIVFNKEYEKYRFLFSYKLLYS